MKKILHVISSPRGNASYSIRLGNKIVEKLLAGYPGSTVKEYDLVNVHFPHLEEAHLTSFFTPAEVRTKENLEAVKHSDEAIAAIQEADIIVIGAPMYNFGIHSSLKAWLDHIVRKGITFSVGEKGAEGLIRGKKVYIAMSSGWIYSEGAAKANDFVVPYLTFMLSFIGLSDITVFRIEGVGIPGNEEQAVEKGLSSVVVD
ncbi:FMN-dependent NADH-azoreductase [Ferruginibacter sp. HRS2-29]|uniref:FMN-dependent NADH-azoreductase n=2 Tax=Ferruginibacter sp. HRS2-29 TaxID=2487334 RepID=UPI0020CDC404|nr:NAD(P)H-dependent oxidoreductase [Ferruginibacter sp. HRS2-29]MCP9751485.1 FMN-dependent NADH-azoreductase [Ferruginibacter sp. HRS2-29]MCP9751528.1 FMN-dependent NADH-azoreductase [Ferruginibacter sp. HRS2-29]MCP9751994.1 FMN-dependent NADH-azoreductase [Ferruginibacter sp. HRS2-29]